MSAERCQTCFGKGYFKRMVEASPPYYADDYLEKIDCPDCSLEVIEIVEAALVEEPRSKPCPRCQLILEKSPFHVICLGHKFLPNPGHNALRGEWLCVCGLGFCKACYEWLED